MKDLQQSVGWVWSFAGGLLAPEHRVGEYPSGNKQGWAPPGADTNKRQRESGERKTTTTSIFFNKMENIEKVILDKNTMAYTRGPKKEQDKHGQAKTSSLVQWASENITVSQHRRLPGLLCAVIFLGGLSEQIDVNVFSQAVKMLSYGLLI